MKLKKKTLKIKKKLNKKNNQTINPRYQSCLRNNSWCHHSDQYQGYVCFSERGFAENHFPNFPMFVYHQKSWSTENTFQSKKNLAWFLGKCFPEKFRRKTLSGSCEKFKNIILFVDYIKFGPQTFDCYIYFVFNIYFSISSLKI